MKVSRIFALFALSTIVEGAFWAAAVGGFEPIIFAIGAVLAKLGMDSQRDLDVAYYKEKFDLGKLGIS